MLELDAQTGSGDMEFRPEAGTDGGRPNARMTLGRVPRRRLAATLAVLSISMVLEVLTLRRFPYKSADLEFVSVGVARDEADPRRLGSLLWDVDAYRHAPSLEPLRAMVRATCPASGPVPTAMCLTEAFARWFDNGPPTHEFFDRDYDPVATFEEHAHGAPGHCVTRSALIATSLLSVGVLARVVQLRPTRPDGHNVFEVWDPHDGWVLIDPSYGSWLDSGNGSRSAIAAVSASGSEHWARGLRRPAGTSRLAPAELDELARPWLRGYIVYPEPWMYTRVGRRASHWPFRGHFVVVGPRSWRLGIGIVALRCAILATALAAILVTLRALLARSSRPRKPLLSSRSDDARDGILP